MLTFQWLLTGAALVFAAMAWSKARRLAARLERLTESYWELRYEHGQLKARVNRDVDPRGDAGAAADGAPDPGRTAASPGTTAFVPLSSLKR